LHIVYQLLLIFPAHRAESLRGVIWRELDLLRERNCATDSCLAAGFSL